MAEASSELILEELLRVLRKRVSRSAVVKAPNLVAALTLDIQSVDLPGSALELIRDGILRTQGRVGEALRAMVGLHPDYQETGRSAMCIAVGTILDVRANGGVGYSERTGLDRERTILAPALAVELNLLNMSQVSPEVLMLMQENPSELDKARKISELKWHLGQHLVTSPDSSRVM